MKTIQVIKNTLILATMFVLGVVLTFLWGTETGLLDSLKYLAGGNLLSPVAILFSATLASLATYTGLKENHQRHIKDQTLTVLHYKRYTWQALRVILPILEEIAEKKRSLDDDKFEDYINHKRKTCPNMYKILSFLDSYQQIAVGVNNGLYDEDLTRLMIGRQLCYFCEKADNYIEWRINNEKDGPAKQAGNFKELLFYSKKWCQDFNNNEKNVY